MIWFIIYIIAVLALFLYWRGPNAIWGGVTIGAFIGFIVMMFSDYGWIIVAKSASIGTIIGGIFELLPHKNNEVMINDKRLVVWNSLNDEEKALLDNDYHNINDLQIMNTDKYVKMLEPIQNMMESGKAYSSFDHPYSNEEVLKYIEEVRKKAKSEGVKKSLSVMFVYVDMSSL